MVTLGWKDKTDWNLVAVCPPPGPPPVVAGAGPDHTNAALLVTISCFLAAELETLGWEVCQPHTASHLLGSD